MAGIQVEVARRPRRDGEARDAGDDEGDPDDGIDNGADATVRAWPFDAIDPYESIDLPSR